MLPTSSSLTPNNQPVLKILFSFLLIFTVLFSPSTLLATPNAITDPFVGVNAKNIFKQGVSENQLEQALDYLADDCKATVVRLFYTPGDQDLRQTQLEWALNKYGPKTGIKFIITLGDSWRLGSSTNTNFYPHNMEKYQTHVVDTVTKYKNYASILAWELLNEPHCQYQGNPDPASCEPSLLDFVENTSQVIRQIDPYHPILIGTIGLYEPNYQSIHSVSTINGLTSHLYDADPRILLRDQSIAQQLGKPHIVEEFNTKTGDRVKLIDKMLTASFLQGSTGFLVWDFSIRGIQDAGDEFTFFEGDAICQTIAKHSPSQPSSYNKTLTPGRPLFVRLFSDFSPLYTTIQSDNTQYRDNHNSQNDPNIIVNQDIGQTTTCTITHSVSLTSQEVTRKLIFPEQISNKSVNKAIAQQLVMYTNSNPITSLSNGSFNRTRTNNQIISEKWTAIIYAGLGRHPDFNQSNLSANSDILVGFSCSNNSCLTAYEYSQIEDPSDLNCRPIYLSEFLLHPVPKFKIPPTNFDQLQKAINNAKDFYPDAYNQLNPNTSYQSLSKKCRDHIFKYMDITSTNSLDYQLASADPVATVSATNYVVRTIPAGTVYTTFSSQNSFLRTISYNQQPQIELSLKDKQKFCQYVQNKVENPNLTEKSSVLTFIKTIFGDNQKPADKKIEITVSYPTAYITGLLQQQLQYNNLIPRSYQQSDQPQASIFDPDNPAPDLGQENERLIDLITNKFAIPWSQQQSL